MIDGSKEDHEREKAGGRWECVENSLVGLAFKDHGDEMERRTCNHRIKWENAMEQSREPAELRCKGITFAWFIPSPSCWATLTEHLPLPVTEQRLPVKFGLEQNLSCFLIPSDAARGYCLIFELCTYGLLSSLIARPLEQHFPEWSECLCQSMHNCCLWPSRGFLFPPNALENKSIKSVSQYLG